MRILVIDDEKCHQDAAQEQLGDEHELTIIGSVNEWYKLVSWDFETEKFSTLDAVLTDLWMPLPTENVSNTFTHLYNRDKACDKGEDISPFGMAIALVAITYGIPVAICSNTDHHEDRIAIALECRKRKSSLFMFCNMASHSVRKPEPVQDATHWQDRCVKDWRKVLERLFNPDILA